MKDDLNVLIDRLSKIYHAVVCRDKQEFE